MMAILPVSLLADDNGRAMLHSSGGVLVNRNAVPATSALFPDDLIETQKNGAAWIDGTGSRVDINPETVVQYEGDELVLEHGSLSVDTSRGMRVRVGCVTVSPVNSAERTVYDVIDMDGKITVSALKNEAYIDARSNRPQQAKQSEHSGRTIVRESEQKSREEKCGGAEIKESGRLAGRGAIMDSPWAKGAGLAGIGGLLCLALCRGDDPISPWRP